MWNVLAHCWVEPENSTPSKPIRWCADCDKEEWEDGTIRPGWVTKAPCYEGKRMSRQGYDRLTDAETWVTKDGRVLSIEKMDREHARAAKNWLLWHATDYAFTEAVKAEAAAAGHDGGDMAQDRLDRIADELWKAAYETKPAVDWMKGQPVFKALKRRLRRKS